MRENSQTNLLRSLTKFRRVALPISNTLAKLEEDTALLEKGSRLIVILDTDVLFRFLFPLLDYFALSDIDKFNAEQLAFQHLFLSKSFQVVLLQPYFEEFQGSLERFRAHDADTAFAWETLLRSGTTSTHSDPLFRLLHGLGGGAEYGESQYSEAVLRYVRTRILSIAIKKGLELCAAMVNQGVLRVDVPGLNLSQIPPATFDEYGPILRLLEVSRSGRRVSNETDAKAMALVKRLNTLYTREGYRFVLLTASGFFSSVESESHLGGALYDIRIQDVSPSCIRNPQYLIIHLLSKAQGTFAQVGGVGGLRRLVDRFVNVVADLEAFSASGSRANLESTHEINYLAAAESIQTQIRPVIEAISKFGGPENRRGGLYSEVVKRLSLGGQIPDFPSSEEEVRLLVSRMLANQDDMLAHFTSTSDALNSAVGELEKLFIRTIYAGVESDFIYPLFSVSDPIGACSSPVGRLIELLQEGILESTEEAFSLLQEIRPLCSASAEACVLCAKVYGALRLYRRALAFAQQGISLEKNSLESLFELGLTYRKVAQREGQVGAFSIAWKLFERASFVSPEDPRVLKEQALLIWLGSKGEWELPPDLMSTPLMHCISLCDRALTKLVTNGRRETVLGHATANDLAYYFAESGDSLRLEQAIQLIESVLRSPLQLPVRLQGSIQDTAGYVHLQQYLKTGSVHIESLRRAINHFLSATQLKGMRPILAEHYQLATRLLMEATQ